MFIAKEEDLLSIISDANINSEKARWHVKIELEYDGGEDDSCQDNMTHVRQALKPLIENGSGIKKIFFLGLPEKD